MIIGFDRALRTVFGRPQTTGRPFPAEAVPESELSESEREEAGRLMRINHTGEVCAQALYQGQALTARKSTVRDALEKAADEENDHLHWCESRIHELGTHASYLNPLFYAGSFAIGAASGLIGDRFSLGFLAETEHQVVRHLDEHLDRLAPADQRSRDILNQMKIDEAEHATTAIEGGGAPLPEPVRKVMALTSRAMTGTTYWI